MADRQLIVKVLGDDKDFRKAMNTSTQSASRFGVAIDKVNKKAGAVTGFFGKGGAQLLGAAAIGTALRSVILAAQEQEVVLGQTQQVVEAAGLSWDLYADRVEDASDRISVASAFDDEAVLRSFQILVRGSGDVEEAFSRVELAADVARGRYIDLEQATLIVNKAALGQVGALRRLGIQIDTNATATEALALLQEKFGGSSARFADSSAASTARLSVALENLKESLGTLLLPLLAELADHLTDAAVAADKLVDGLEDLANVKVPPIRVPIIGEIGGGKVGDLLKQALGLLNPKDILIPVRIVRAVIGGDDKDDPANIFKGIGDAASKGLAAAAAGLEKFQKRFTGSGQGMFDFLDTVNKMLAAQQAAVAKALAHAQALRQLQDAADDAALAVEQVGLALERAGATPTLRDDIAALQTIGRALEVQEAAIRAQLRLNKDSAALQSQLVSVQGQQIANEQALNAAVKERAATQAKAAKDARQAAQFKALGLSPTGDKPIPTIDNLTKQLNQLDTKITGGKNQAILNAIRKVLTDPVNKATDETREAIRELFATIRGELDDGLKGPLTATSGLNTKKIVEGLGLDAATAQEIRGRLSGFNTAGRALAAATQSNLTPGAAFGIGAGVPIVESHVTLEVDGDVIARTVTRSQQKTRRRNPQQKRGPNRIGA